MTIYQLKKLYPELLARVEALEESATRPKQKQKQPPAHPEDE